MTILRHIPPSDWAFLTLRDAVDYTRFLVYVTIEQQRFELAQSVGGTIETLVITPGDGVRWLARDELVKSDPGPPAAKV